MEPKSYSVHCPQRENTKLGENIRHSSPLGIHWLAARTRFLFSKFYCSERPEVERYSLCHLGDERRWFHHAHKRYALIKFNIASSAGNVVGWRGSSATLMWKTLNGGRVEVKFFLCPNGTIRERKEEASTAQKKNFHHLCIIYYTTGWSRYNCPPEMLIQILFALVESVDLF